MFFQTFWYRCSCFSCACLYFPILYILCVAVVAVSWWVRKSDVSKNQGCADTPVPFCFCWVFLFFCFFWLFCCFWDFGVFVFLGGGRFCFKCFWPAPVGPDPVGTDLPVRTGSTDTPNKMRSWWFWGGLKNTPLEKKKKSIWKASIS